VELIPNLDALDKDSRQSSVVGQGRTTNNQRP
jgi:hypothetical protein